MFQKLLFSVPQISRTRDAARPMTPQMAHVGKGDGEFIFIPSSVPEESVAALNETIAESQRTRRQVGDSKLVVFKGVIDRKRRLAGLRTELSAVVAAAAALDYRYSDHADHEARRWEGVRRVFRRNAEFETLAWRDYSSATRRDSANWA